MPRYPFPLGATVPPQPSTTTAPPFWTKLGPSAIHWQSRDTQPLPRFEHIYPQQSGGQQGFVRVSPSVVTTP